MTFADTRAIGGLHPELPGWTEQLAIAIAAPGNAHDIRIDQSDRITVEADTPERPRARWAKRLVLFAAAFGLGWATLVGAHRFLRGDSVSSPPAVPSPSAPAAIANSGEGQRLKVHPTIVRKVDRAATASVPAGPKLRPPTRIAHAKPPRTVAVPAPSVSSYAPPPPSPAPSPAASTVQPPVEAPVVAVPDTRPTTIDGWMLREVVNGTAVLEGPDGIWRVKRGDTVPGVGQIEEIFSWGNRMIVATSRGLISTP